MTTDTKQKVALDIQLWTTNEMQRKQLVASGAATTIHYSVNQLERGTSCSIFINDQLLKKVQSNSKGSIAFSDDGNVNPVIIAIRKD